VTVSWGATTSPPATGYTVRAYDALTGTERAITSACAGVVAALSCVEAGVPDGSWKYTVTPHLEGWAGSEGTKSYPITIETGAPQATALVLVNGTGGTVGVLDPELDRVRIDFSEPLAVSSICSTWTSDGIDQTLSGSDVVVTLADGAGDNSLTVTTSQCTLHVGAVTLGADYITTANATFSGSGISSSRVTWDASARRLVVEFGALASGALETTPVGAGTASYTADAAMSDLAANPAGTTPLTAPNQRL
jgi:hypothetical protein